VGQHDLSYRLFFAHQRMIQDLLREIVGEQWVERIDFDSGEKMEASFVSTKYESRESDVIWKFQRQDGGEPVYVYILLEFQSRPDPSMAVRFMGYESLFYQSLMASQPAAERRKLPPVIPVVVYHGSEPWNVATDLGSLIGDLDPSAEIYRPQLRYRPVDAAAYPLEKLVALNSPVAELFRIERSRDWGEVRASLPRLRQSIPADEASLRRTFAAWLQNVILPRFGLFREERSATLTLEELETKLAESSLESRQEDYLEGIQEGEARLVLRQLRLKFGPLESETENQVRSADPDRLLEWGERVLTAKSLQDVFQD
jgi:predicted transposase YdaD